MSLSEADLVAPRVKTRSGQHAVPIRIEVVLPCTSLPNGP